MIGYWRHDSSARSLTPKAAPTVRSSERRGDQGTKWWRLVERKTYWEERIDLRVVLALDHRGVVGKEGVGREREAAETWPYHCKYDSRQFCRVHERLKGWVTDTGEVALVTDLAWVHPASAAVVINVLEDLKDAFRLDLHEHLYRVLSAVLLIWHVEVVMRTSPVFAGKD